ncbi:hypothetical protein MY4824_008382 [Beauveria thailandica]
MLLTPLKLSLKSVLALTDATPAYQRAVALHPVNEFAYFELEWSQNTQWISEAQRVVREAYAEYERAATEVDSGFLHPS